MQVHFVLKDLFSSYLVWLTNILIKYLTQFQRLEACLYMYRDIIKVTLLLKITIVNNNYISIQSTLNRTMTYLEFLPECANGTDTGIL